MMRVEWREAEKNQGGSRWVEGKIVEERFYLLEAVPESGVVTSLELVQNWDRRVSSALGEDRSGN